MIAYYFNGKEVVSTGWNYVDNSTNLCKDKIMKEQKTFKQSILDITETFKQEGDQFSIFDITRTLRHKVNDGEIQITDKNPQTIAGKTTYSIDHFEVRNIFLGAVSSGEINGLIRTFNNAGGYNLYQNDDTNSVSLANTVASIGQQSTAFATNQTMPATPVVRPIIAPTNQVDTNALRTYLTNMKGKVSQVSMKRVQSRFDSVQGKSCQDYATLIESLGYQVIKAPSDAPSKWYVLA